MPVVGLLLLLVLLPVLLVIALLCAYMIAVRNLAVWLCQFPAWVTAMTVCLAALVCLCLAKAVTW